MDGHSVRSQLGRWFYCGTLGQRALHPSRFFSAETVADPERLRAEVILAIAEHDNGWWEWEAIPDLYADGFPAGLGEVLQSQQAGIDRWRNRRDQSL